MREVTRDDERVTTSDDEMGLGGKKGEGYLLVSDWG